MTELPKELAGIPPRRIVIEMDETTATRLADALSDQIKRGSLRYKNQALHDLRDLCPAEALGEYLERLTDALLAGIDPDDALEALLADFMPPDHEPTPKPELTWADVAEINFIRKSRG
jgi:hypothetical protein